MNLIRMPISHRDSSSHTERRCLFAAPTPKSPFCFLQKALQRVTLYALACSLDRRSRDLTIHPQKVVGKAQMLPNPSRDWGRDSAVVLMESEGQFQV